ncbi:MAG: hypothetical protein DHS20C16_20870 [Phycisphaerae bacterium]|nr:MAG: hypothetical protein DHS20C16_20870 [Phycisphaerae bacterium]
MTTFIAAKPIHHDTMTYARARLWLGIASVGTLVVAASTALVFGVPQKAFGMVTVGIRAEIVSWLQVLACFVLLSIPFDVLGGYWLPRAFGRKHPGFGTFASAWGRGVLVQSIVMLGSALFILSAGRHRGCKHNDACNGCVSSTAGCARGPITENYHWLAINPLAKSDPTVASRKSFG